MPNGKYFFIVSQLNGLVIDIEGGNRSEGANLITWDRKHAEPGCDNQLFYEEHITGTIRSKMNDLCITATGQGLKMYRYKAGNTAQCWQTGVGDGMIWNKFDNKVFDILQNNTNKGAKVGAWSMNNQYNQKWRIDRVEARYFMIKSSFNGLFLDIKSAQRTPGAQVIMWGKTGGDNQYWYEDEQSVIRSKMNQFAISAKKGACATMQPYRPDQYDHYWHRFGEFIVMRAHKGHVVLDIKERKRDMGTPVIAWDRKPSGNENQKWQFVH